MIVRRCVWNVTGAQRSQTKSGTMEVREGFLKEVNSESKRRQKQRKGYQGKTG